MFFLDWFRLCNLLTPNIHILHMSRSLQLNINLNLSKLDILINEGTTWQISLKNSSRQDCNFEHIIVKWNSSSTPELHNLHILSSAGVFKYLPFSIFKLLLLTMYSDFNKCWYRFFLMILLIAIKCINWEGRKSTLYIIFCSRSLF